MKININGDEASLVELFQLAAALRLPPWHCRCGERNRGKDRYCSACGNPHEPKEPPANAGRYEDNLLRR